MVMDVVRVEYSYLAHTVFLRLNSAAWPLRVTAPFSFSFFPILFPLFICFCYSRTVAFLFQAWLDLT
jgi:hypothetical protein